jgi:hemerythrin-like domain-containing protein
MLLTSTIEGFDLHRANQQFYMKNHVQIIEKTMQKIANARFNIQQLDLLITFIERNQHLSENIFHVLLGYFIKKYAVHILFSQDDSIIKQRVLQWDPSQDFEKAIDEMFVGL